MIRLLTILFIISLYLIAFYQNHETSEQWDLSGRTVESETTDPPPHDSKPYYAEHFVSKEKAGKVSHVSSIAQAGNNTLLCTWYAGSREGAKDVAIFLSIFDQGNNTWSKPEKIIDREQVSSNLDRYIKKIGNSLVFSDRQGRIWLFYASVTLGGWSGTSLNYKVSLDNGRSWSTGGKMILSPFFNLTNNVKNKGLILDDGSLLIPAYHEFINKYSQLIWIRPNEDRAKYRIGKITREAKAIQPSILHEKNKDLIAFFRNMSDKDRKYILTSTSSDLGKTWSGLSVTQLPNPNSGFDMIALDSGAFLGVINNSFRGRSNLSLVISFDEGKNWKVIKTLENNPEKEYSYPSIIKSMDGLYHITYTYERKRIKHVVLNESWIRNIMEDKN